MPEAPIIRKLTITRFRGIQDLKWNPAATINIILGGGDVGKTTILEAIALLFNPSNAAVVSESDYWKRDTQKEFIIEAVVDLSGIPDISTSQNFAWPWAWDGNEAVEPKPRADGADDMPAPDDPVYRVRVRGTTELDLTWEIVQPDGQTNHFSAALRRSIGLVRLSADERNDRDLRLVYGSALDRLFSDAALRARIGKRVSEQEFDEALTEKGKEKITQLDKRMTKAALPNALKLGLTTSQGLSIGALIGLLAAKDDVTLPLGTWGAGTRRMAALEIASSTQKEAGITIIDEIERGLEPYRLRKLISILHARTGQTFVTTHSPVAIACAGEGHLWYLDAAGSIGVLPYERIKQQQRRDPETFLAKVAVIAEGETEVGFLSFILQKAFGAEPLDHGVRVCDGQGNNATLGVLETLASAGLVFAGLADNEGKDSGKWKALKEKLGDKLLQWPDSCTEKHVISAVPEQNLLELLKDEDGDYDGQRLRNLADRLATADKELSTIQGAIAAQGRTLRQLIIEAATGSHIGAPEGKEKEWKGHARCWFKSERGGRELARKMADLGAWAEIAPRMLPLINSILLAAGRHACKQLDL
jgi:putative ATP-dependent endonuclease of OLD family